MSCVAKRSRPVSPGWLAYGSRSAAVAEPSEPSQNRSPAAPTAPSWRAFSTAPSSPQYGVTSGNDGSAASTISSTRSSSVLMTGPAISCTAAIPSDAARRSMASCASRRCARVSDARATSRTRSCAGSRIQPFSPTPAPARPGTAARSADDTTAECTSTRAR